ncbi:MAG: hypothetical protein LBS16_02870 [Prevotellaceae bacterium]|jgi:hypothetical protein|nr:hypothetical protein [Prevotellaceae bacterium]
MDRQHLYCIIAVFTLFLGCLTAQEQQSYKSAYGYRTDKSDVPELEPFSRELSLGPYQYPDEPHANDGLPSYPPEPHDPDAPIGDAVLPMILLMTGYGLWKRKRRLLSK